MAEAKMGKVKTLKEEDDTANLFSKLELKLPFFSNQQKNEFRTAIVGVGEEEFEKQKPNIVWFPNARPVVTPPLDVEVEESSGRTHNPMVIWQVYALGGFIISKWVWARWQERKDGANRASPDDDQSSQSPTGDNE